MLIVISAGTMEANRATAAEHGLSDVLFQRGEEVFNQYLVAGVPSAVLVLPDGTIGSPLAEGVDAVRDLILSNSNIKEFSLVNPDVKGNGRSA
jgi:hypothetical protein